MGGRRRLVVGAGLIATGLAFPTTPPPAEGHAPVEGEGHALVAARARVEIHAAVEGDAPAVARSRTAWGAYGHEIAARVAATDLPAAMPAFFRERAAQLEYLNPEPDRWRVDRFTELDEAFTYDHFINLERLPEGALRAPDRWIYLRELGEAGIERPERIGFLPFRIVELTQRLTAGFQLWRSAPDRERPWIEDRIVNDAGLLGHYVTDASQPHHTTIHYDGWDPAAANPEGFSTERGFHARFESAFVSDHVDFADLLPAMRWTSRRLGEVRPEVVGYILETHGAVEALYRLDRDVGFDVARPTPETVAFTVERLTAGAAMLRDLWWTAWLDSGEGG